MQYTFPNYYKEFSCIAGACPDTCCAGWQIVIDDQTLKKYQHFKGPFRNRLHNDIDWKEHVFRQYNRRCAFLNEENLCDIYTEAGPEMFCRTCRNYPRHIEEFEGLREISLSLSCPEAARILLSQKEKVHFITKEKKTKEEVYDDFDYFLYSNLEDIREAILNVIQDRSVDIRIRIERVIQIGASAQRHYDEGDLVMWDECEEQDKPQIHGDHEEDMLLQKQAMFLIEDLELLYDDWEDVLIESQELLFGQGEKAFAGNRKRFDAWWRNHGGCAPHMTLDIFLEQIIVYFISIYLLGAVYDDNISGKVNACVGHAVELYMLLMARWLRNGETLSVDDLIELSYRYSREIEHSDENLEQVEVLDWFGL